MRHGISCWALALVGAIYWFDRRRPWPDGPIFTPPARLVSFRAALVFCTVLALAAPLLYPNRHRNYYKRVDKSIKPWVPAWKWLDHNAPPGSRIAFTQMYLPYYNFGRRFQNTPRYVSVNRVNAENYHDYEGSGLKRIFAEPDYASWVRNLEAERIDFVHWGNRPKDGHDTVELGWMIERPDRFQPVVDQARCKLFRFLPPQPRP